MALSVATIDAAIEAIISNGQRISIEGITYDRASLQSLIDLRDKIQSQSDRATRPAIRAVNISGMGY